MDTMQADTDAGMYAYVLDHPEEFILDMTINFMAR